LVIETAQDFKMHSDLIIHGVDSGGLLLGEKLVADRQGEIANEHYYIGLYSRARLDLDVFEKKIARKANFSG
jgi:hypothetical protein